MNYSNISFILIVMSTWLVAIILFLRGNKRKSAIMWGWVAIAVSIWGIGGAIATITIYREVSLFGWKIAHIGTIFIPVVFFHFVNTYCNLRQKYLLRCLYLVGTFFLYYNFFNLMYFFGDVRFVFGKFYYLDWPKYHGKIYVTMYILFYWILLAYSFLCLVKLFLNSKGIKRNEVKYLMLSSSIGWLGAHSNFATIFLVDRNIYPYLNIFIAIYPIITAYAIIRYRLMDINIAITRTGIFIAVYSLVLGIPFALAFGWKEQLINLVGGNWWMVPLVAMTVLATVGPFIYLYINKKAEDRLLREQKAYQSVLRSASSGMIRIKDIDKLLNLVVRVVTKTVKIRHAAVYLFDTENNRYVLMALRGNKEIAKNDFIDTDSPLVWQLTHKKEVIVSEEMLMKFRDEPEVIALAKLAEQLTILKSALVIPSFVDEKLIGILMLGEKISGKLYSQDDIVVFSVLANQAALAIENAQFYDEIKNTHQQLFQAEKMATIGTMADGLSHQINNRFHALALISGDSLDILKTFDASACSEQVKQVFSDLKDALQRIESNVLKGGEIVKGLLKYSRPNENTFEFTDFSNILFGSIDMLQYKIKLKEIDLAQNIPFDAPKLYCNPVQLQEVFFNLIDNAYDAIKEREATLKEPGYRGRIEVSASGLDGKLQIVVSDNGIGVRDPDKKKLFTPFFTTKATSRKGTGLGLYVIEKVISSHNGKIDISSKYQSGTQFVIHLPTVK